MRLLELHLKKFGPFTDRVLELATPGGPGLVVIHGPNEAGKTSALRAVHDLLYGIPSRSPDDFVHRYADLRIGARLLFSDGEELSFLRRKGNKNTLRSLDDREVIDAERLRALVEAVPESHFENFYGLDHRRLVEGSEALLADDGELGRALFGAGLGSARFRSVLGDLETEAAALFAPRAKNLPINRTVKEWEDLTRRVREESLRPADWEARESELLAREGRLAELDEEIEGERIRLSRLRRIKGALPSLGRRRHCLAQLAELPSVVPLRDDFEERLRTARSARDQARLIAERARKTIEKENTKRESLQDVSELLIDAEAIDRLHADLGGYRDALGDLPRRLQEQEALDASIAAALASMGAESSPVQLEAFRRGQSAAPRIRALASDSDRLRGTLDNLERDLADAHRTKERLVEQRDSMGAPIDAGALERTLARVRKLGDIDERIEKQFQEVEGLRTESERERSRLGLERYSLSDLETLRVPSNATLEAYAARGEAHAQRRVRCEESIVRATAERAEVEERLARRQNAGEVPSERLLERQRIDRDDLWRKIRSEWLGPAEDRIDSIGRQELAERFESRLADVDRMADRLRHDADRVAQQSADRARLESLSRTLEEEEDVRQSLDRERDALVSEWQGIWTAAGIDPPRSEAAMEWRRGFELLVAKVGQLRDAKLALDRDERARGDARAALAGALDSLANDGAAVEREAAGPSETERLDGLLARADDRMARLRDAVEAERHLSMELSAAAEAVQRLEREQERILAEQARWQEDWGQAVSGLALPENPPTHEATERLASIDRLLDALRAQAEMNARVDGIRGRIEQFRGAVKDLLLRGSAEDRALSATTELDPEAAVLRKHAQLQESRRSEAVRDKIEENLADAREELEAADLNLSAAAEILLALQREAGVEEEASLDGALENWKHFDSLDRKRAEAEEELAALSEGRSLADLEAESRGVDSDALAAELEARQAAYEEKVNERNDLSVEIRTEREAQRRDYGGERVAELSEAAEAKLASLRRDASRYLELRLAQTILEREIEAYRQANQGPVLQRATAFFAALTLGAYPELQSELDDSGRSRLVAIRGAVGGEGGARIPIEGLSSGTRDQLFLALRLASLEVSLSRTEPMPLIADDILVEFDQDRSRAGLAMLAELAQKTQILLFTHHAYLADQARDLGHRAIVHEL